MDYLITYGIKPVPAGTKWRSRNPQRRYHFEMLKTGESMFVPCDTHLQEQAVRNAASQHNKVRQTPGKLTTRLAFDKVYKAWGIWVHCVRKT
jgi:hypothetical protein